MAGRGARDGFGAERGPQDRFARSKDAVLRREAARKKKKKATKKKKKSAFGGTKTAGVGGFSGKTGTRKKK